MSPFIIAIGLLALALAATKEDPAATLLSPVNSLIGTLGSLVENARERLRKFILEPTSPAPGKFFMSAFFLVGSLTWTMIDTCLMGFCLRLIMPSSVLITTGSRSIDLFFARYFYTCAALAITILMSLSIHYLFEYLQEAFPQHIRGIVAVAVLVSVIGIGIALCSLRYFGATTAFELNKSIASHDFNIPSNLITKSALLSTLLFAFGILASGLCWYLGFASTIHQITQGISLILIYLPLSVLWVLLIVLKRVLDALLPLIAIPLQIMAQIIKFFKWLWKNKGPKDLLTIFIILSAFACFQGCTEDRGRVIVAMLDNTGSFTSEKDNALNKLDEIIDELELGDEFYFVLIGEKSFSDRRLVYLKSDGSEASIESKMHFYKRKDEIKTDILQMINVNKSTRTDVAGSLDRVQTIINKKDRKGFSKYLLIFSDLSDNTSIELSGLSLDSVHVLVLFASSDKADYNTAQNQIDRWNQYFQNSRASSVEILTHDLSMTFDIKTFIK